MRWLRSALTWLVLAGVWLFVCSLLWQAATTGQVPDPRRYSSDVVSFSDQPLAFVIAMAAIVVAFLGIPAFAWISWRDTRRAHRFMSQRKPPIDHAIRRDLDGR